MKSNQKYVLRNCLKSCTLHQYVGQHHPSSSPRNQNVPPEPWWGNTKLEERKIRQERKEIKYHPWCAIFKVVKKTMLHRKLNNVKTNK